MLLWLDSSSLSGGLEGDVSCLTKQRLLHHFQARGWFSPQQGGRGIAAGLEGSVESGDLTVFKCIDPDVPIPSL